MICAAASMVVSGATTVTSVTITSLIRIAADPSTAASDSTEEQRAGRSAVPSPPAAQHNPLLRIVAAKSHQ